MLSRILSGAAALPAEALTWPVVDGPAAGPGAAGRGKAAGEDTAHAARHSQEFEEQMERRAGEARQAGLREGQAAGRAQAASDLQPVLEKLAAGIQEIASLRPRLQREAQAELVALALAIARRILHRELSVDPAALDGLVGSALEKLAGQEICRVRLHPELEAGVRQALARAGRSGLEVRADATLERGAVLVETSRGRLDASLETQLAEIGRGLADRLPER